MTMDMIIFIPYELKCNGMGMQIKMGKQNKMKIETESQRSIKLK